MMDVPAPQPVTDADAQDALYPLAAPLDWEFSVSHAGFDVWVAYTGDYQYIIRGYKLAPQCAEDVVDEAYHYWILSASLGDWDEERSLHGISCAAAKAICLRHSVSGEWTDWERWEHNQREQHERKAQAVSALKSTTAKREALLTQEPRLAWVAYTNYSGILAFSPVYPYSYTIREVRWFFFWRRYRTGIGKLNKLTVKLSFYKTLAGAKAACEHHNLFGPWWQSR